jgi:cytochrome-b5 reductase
VPYGQIAKWGYRLLWLLAIVYSVDKYYNTPLSENHAVFNPPRFTPFYIIDRQDVSPTSFILTLRPHKDVSSDIDPYADSWKQGTWSVEFKQPQLQIARSYTPLPPQLDSPNSPNLRFLIRCEKGGEVSNYLTNLPPQATIEIRGPHPELDLPTNITNIVFLAGGTGIAPAMQVIYALLEKRVEGPNLKIHIIWANRRRVDCVGGISLSQSRTSKGSNPVPLPAEGIVRELQLMQARHPENLSVDYLVDEEGTFLDQKMISAITGKATGDPTVSGTGSKLLFVSGPEGFVSFIAGPKRWEDGVENQGELGGVIGRMSLKGWQVWKT